MTPQQISYLVESQFPSFYKTEGPNFIAFLEAYYEWLESDDQAVGRARNLLGYFDVDRSVNEFVSSFKSKYLTNFPYLAETDQRTFVKRATEIYRSKGSQRAIELLFRLLFNEDIAVYYPAVDILRPSDGKWVVPVYIELSEATKTASFIGNRITGSLSGAKAVVSRVSKRTLAGKTFDVAYLTNIEGDFKVDEIVTYDGLIDGSPTIIGSLTSIVIDDNGQDFEVGDVVDVLSDATGRQASARVAEVGPATGKIDYSIVDGGAGYTLTSNVVVSEKVLTYSSLYAPSPFTTSFQDGETVTQPLTYTSFITASGTFARGQFVYGIDSTTSDKLAGGRIVEVSQNPSTGVGNVVICPSTISTLSISTITNANTTGSYNVGEVVFQYSANSNFKKAVGLVLAANTTKAVVDVSIGPFATNEIVYGSSSNCRANAVSQTIINDPFTDTDISTLTVFYSLTSPTASIVTNTIADRTVTAEVVASNTAQIGVYRVDASRAFKVGGYITGGTSGCRADINTVSAGDVGGFDVGSLTDEEDIYINSDIIGSNNAANVPFLSITISGNGIGSNVGFIDSITVVDGGSGYTNSSTVTISGGSPSTLAVAAVNTHSNGTIRNINITNIGAGYDSAPTITVSGGTGANLQAVVDPGYGFPKNTNGDINSVIDTCLRKEALTVGTIASITNINPGSNNTASPFVKVINPLVAGAGRRHFKLNISGNTKPFLIGESITQETYQPVVTLNMTNMSGAFNSGQRETVKQVRADGNTVYGELISATFVDLTDTGVLRVRVDDVANTFDTSNTIIGLTSLSTGTLASKTTSTTAQLAKGRIIASAPSSIDIFRTRYSVSFTDNVIIKGASSGAQATVSSLVDIDGSPIYGTSAVISSPAQSANGTLLKVDVMDSGFGYTNGEIVTLKAEGNPYIATGVARLLKQGTGDGYWDNTASFLSSDKKIQDSDFYQDFSYQIESSLSLERYADVVKDTVHLAGTKTFGKVNRFADLDVEMGTEDLEDRNAVLTVTGGNNEEFIRLEEVTYVVDDVQLANGYIDNIRAEVTVNGANTEFIPGEQVSRPTLFANTSYGEIESTYSDYAANTTTLYLNNVRGMFNSSGQVQSKLDRIQLTYTLTSYTGGVGGGDPITFEYPEVVYQSNGSANVGVGNLTSANATHLIIKPATKLLIASQTGTIAAGDDLYQRANSSSPNTAVGIVGLSNSTVIEVIDPRGQFLSGEYVYTSTGSAHILSIGGKSNLFTKSNTVIMRVANLTDVGFANGEIITQPATGASGTIALGNTTSISVNDVTGTFNTINPIVGSTSGVQADVSNIDGPFSIIGATSGANGDIGTIQSDRVTTTLVVNSSIGAINTITVANVAGQFVSSGSITGANSEATATITSVEIQAY